MKIQIFRRVRKPCIFPVIRPQILAKFFKVCIDVHMKTRLWLPFQNHCKQHGKQCLTCLRLLSSAAVCLHAVFYTLKLISHPLINEVLTLTDWIDEKIRFSLKISGCVWKSEKIKKMRREDVQWSLWEALGINFLWLATFKRWLFNPIVLCLFKGNPRL